MRKNLKMFRVGHGLSQADIAFKLGITRAAYSAIEKGIREGRFKFWQALQKEFGVPDAEMWELMKIEEPK